MRFTFILFTVLLYCGFAQAQLPARGSLAVKLPSVIFFNEVNGKPFIPYEQSGISGSPFINQEWKLCVIKLNDGRYFEDVPIKLNNFNETILYRSSAGKELEVSKGVITEVQMPDTTENGVAIRHFCNGFKPVDNNDENTFYEVLDRGRVDLLLCRKVKMSETTIIGSGTEKEYQSFQDYYMSVGNIPVKCKKSSSFFIELFADKKDLVKKYIDDYNLKFKSEKDCRRIVSYYNSL